MPSDADAIGILAVSPLKTGFPAEEAPGSSASGRASAAGIAHGAPLPVRSIQTPSREETPMELTIQRQLGPRRNHCGRWLVGCPSCGRLVRLPVRLGSQHPAGGARHGGTLDTRDPPPRARSRPCGARFGAADPFGARGGRPWGRRLRPARLGLPALSCLGERGQWPQSAAEMAAAAAASV